MHSTIKCAGFLVLLTSAVGLAVPASAEVRSPLLGDSQEAGSVIVFPKFIQGTVTVDGVVTPQTEIEVGVLCPAGVTCAEGEPVKIRFQWVCPSSEASASTSYVCVETDFDVTTTVFGKVVFNANGTPETGDAAVKPATPPAAPCWKGYLIGWVISPTNDQPIKFDGLIGDAVLRESGTAVSDYGAIPIQANPALANGAAITTVTDPLTGVPSLVFDGGTGHYQAVSGAIQADVKFDNTVTGPPFNQTYLTLLTLNVRSNLPNFPTFADLDFYNENEVLTSTFTEFICWEEVLLENIDTGLTQASQGTRKGLVVSGQAIKVPLNGIYDIAGPVTLLGLVDTLEGPTVPALGARAYISPTYNNSVPISATFVPF
jgi:hypothetical protein